MPPLGLPDLQRWFQAVVTHPDGVVSGARSADALSIAPHSRADLESIVTRSGKLSAEERLSIYANAYYARLIECIGESFPVLKRALGEETFNGFAFGYLQAYPSQSYTLARLADRFVQYLQETRPNDAGDWPDFLIDLARLEWTIGDVFDGPGVENTGVLDGEDLLGVPTERWGNIRLTTAPCLRLLETRFPVNGYYTSMRRAEPEARPDPPEPDDAYIAVTRREYVVRRHDLSQVQFRLLDQLHGGKALGDAIEHALAVCDVAEDRLAADLPRWFEAWTRQQFFVSFCVD